MRSQILSLVRAIGLMPFLDRLRMQWFTIKNRRDNLDFLKAHPSFKLPSDSILYETYKLDYQQYYKDGYQVAQEIFATASKHRTFDQCNILDWGCGPARVARHLPNLLPDGSQVYGSDFNQETISWCKHSIDNVHFLHNRLHPPMDIQSEIFDVIYGISVLTHLSIDNQRQWLGELQRLLKPNGLLILTTQGDAFVQKLNRSEQNLYRGGQPVIRKGGSEGRRTFSSFHPTPFLKSLFQDFQILEHRLGQQAGRKIEQDLWILQKRIEPAQ